ncbi:DUF5996 family protein [Rubrivirga sp. IMCC45206]|uniref:DUF5996 family protein n=1 Tax=Rubrivirga sp. IMCC45206 TaxID=3391614 RepID=UPI00398FCEDF
MSDAWPALPPFADWQPTADAVHRWTQIVGKVRLAGTPWVNHAWHTPLYVTARGLSTGLIPGPGVELAFDFVDHRLAVSSTSGAQSAVALAPMSVAEFDRQLAAALAAVGASVEVWPQPVEIPGEIVPFPDDTAPRPYDADAVTAYWRALVAAHRVMTAFRARFIGKASPVHFFWGAFDLAATRFSGRTAPRHPGGAPNLADWVMAEAYSHEVSSAGLWPGGGVGEAMFYAYAYPEPDGFREAPVEPEAARYDEALGEYLLPYEVVRSAPDPDAALLAFLQSTYQAAADAGDWDRAALEADLPADAR